MKLDIRRYNTFFFVSLLSCDFFNNSFLPTATARRTSLSGDWTGSTGVLKPARPSTHTHSNAVEWDGCTQTQTHASKRPRQCRWIAGWRSNWIIEATTTTTRLLPLCSPLDLEIPKSTGKQLDLCWPFRVSWCARERGSGRLEEETRPVSRWEKYIAWCCLVPLSLFHSLTYCCSSFIFSALI